MKNIVVYESKYGSTKRYANWIGEELNCKVCKISDIKIEELTNYDNIIFGGWLCAGKVKGLDKIWDNMDKFKDKKLIIFTVGLSEDGDEQYEQLLKKFENMDNVQNFYLRGAMDFKNLKVGDKILLSIFKIVLRKEVKKGNKKAQDTLKSYEHPVDFTKKEKIKPIIDTIKEV